MTKWSGTWFAAWMVLMPAYTYAIDQKDLIKVNDKSNPQCVEYYVVKGETYCSTTSNRPKQINPGLLKNETQTILFDNRPWQAAWGEKTDAHTTIEYTPAGDNIEQWHELITSQFFPNIPDSMTAKKFAEGVIGQINQTGLNPIVTILQNTPEQVLFEFRITQPSNLMQDELQKIVKGKKGIYVLHYVVKTADMGDKARRLWVQNLLYSKIKE